jgi:hypothetical protein
MDRRIESVSSAIDRGITGSITSDRLDVVYLT